MKVIIFFGHHKVGSTALQTYFARNSLSLLRAGILYPAVESEGLTNMLAHAMGMREKPALGCMNLREPHNALAFRMLSTETKGDTPPWHGPLPGFPAMVQTLRRQAEIFQPHTVILCSEVFSNFGNRFTKLVGKLHEIFPDAEYELYCALRRPDEYNASWYGQRLRFGHKLPPLSSPEGLSVESIHFDYKKMLAPWVNEFAGAPLHLRNYTDILKAGGSVKDFTAQVGCEFPADLPEKGPSNPSLPRAAFEILRRANNELSTEIAGALREYLLRYPLAEGLPKSADIEVFGRAQRERMVRTFAPIEAYLNEVSGQTAFFPDIEEIGKTRPVPLEEATRAFLSALETKALPNPEITAFLRNFQETA